MLIDVLTRLAADTGLEPTQQRPALINLLNNAAKELHRMLECNRVYREITLAVPPDSVVALPSFIGELKGMRMHTNELPFDLNSISSPRYTSNTLGYKFKNWRDLGDCATMALPSVVGPLTIATTGIETPNAVISINGQTNFAFSTEEQVTLANNVNLSQMLWGPRIDKISCITQRHCDINIYDANKVLLATLHNNEVKTRYKLVDVSQVFWTLDTFDGMSLIDVLYKIPLNMLINDSDSLPAGDEYDDAWYFLAYHLHLLPQQGRDAEATSALQKAIQMLQTAKDSSEKSIVKKLQFGRNRFYGIFRKYRYFPGAVTNVDNNIQT